MSHLPLDARAILHHLNELGYRNITAEQLREFLKDLRKLIKHEERLAAHSKEDYFSSLHKRDTVSSRAKLGECGKDNGPLAVKDNGRQQRPEGEKNRLPSGASSSTMNVDIATLMRDKLLMDEAKGPIKASDNNRRSRSRTRNPTKNVCRDVSCFPRSTSRISSQDFPARLKNKHPSSDPVALYHYYQKEWMHFRNKIPGENSHTDLRWEIRNKLSDPK